MTIQEEGSTSSDEVIDLLSATSTLAHRREGKRVFEHFFVSALCPLQALTMSTTCLSPPGVASYCWATDGITHECKALGLVPPCEPSWQSLSVVSWLVHKNLNHFDRPMIHPLFLSPSLVICISFFPYTHVSIRSPSISRTYRRASCHLGTNSHKRYF